MFLFYSRPLFRAWEIFCNHAARLLAHKERMRSVRFSREWAELNRKRMAIQQGLGRISNSHAHVCAQCGHCCKGMRERDAFLDRVIQDPHTEQLGARRRTGEMVGLRIAQAQGRVLHQDAPKAQGCCNELTCAGCRLPQELRPMQCLAYFCGAAAKALSQQECEEGIRLLKALLRLQWQGVQLAFRSRFGR
ncbi:MAG: hypothetical protein CFK49_01550 [Armatimonadetes bacterium JP3_11]|nr:MAG: hypothetical protein CFK48_04325 [Armatimonadetes bacterium CP1_7O]OYT75771.1 MAG: hypothetical protein CFK49_01550 [Armatimonadetes bacterium JP3_11]RMH09390.1 MAG: hypothetical protein D6697_03710 [Armatimonadota bacterium]